MNNEHIEKTMTFIVEQQAKFEVDMQLLQEAQARTEQRLVETVATVNHTSQVAEQSIRLSEQSLQSVAQSTETIARLAEVTSQLAFASREGFNDVNGKINVLIDSQMRTDEQIKQLKHSQTRTDKALRKRARHRAKGRNGQNN